MSIQTIPEPPPKVRSTKEVVESLKDNSDKLKRVIGSAEKKIAGIKSQADKVIKKVDQARKIAGDIKGAIKEKAIKTVQNAGSKLAGSAVGRIDSKVGSKVFPVAKKVVQSSLVPSLKVAGLSVALQTTPLIDNAVTKKVSVEAVESGAKVGAAKVAKLVEKKAVNQVAVNSLTKGGVTGVTAKLGLKALPVVGQVVTANELGNVAIPSVATVAFDQIFRDEIENVRSNNALVESQRQYGSLLALAEGLPDKQESIKILASEVATQQSRLDKLVQLGVLPAGASLDNPAVKKLLEFRNSTDSSLATENFDGEGVQSIQSVIQSINDQEIRQIRNQDLRESIVPSLSSAESASGADGAKGKPCDQSGNRASDGSYCGARSATFRAGGRRPVGIGFYSPKSKKGKEQFEKIADFIGGLG